MATELVTLGSVVKEVYENEPDTNAFTDAEKAALAALQGPGAGLGDMLAETYDPQGIEANVFDRSNHAGQQALDTISDSGALAALSTVDTDQIEDEAITLPKLAGGTANRVIGFDGNGDPIEVSAGTNVTISGGTISTSATIDGTSVPAGFIAPEEEGAVGDGETDDFDAFADTLTAAKASGAGIWLSPGKNYLIDGKLLFSAWDGFVIEGNGATITAHEDVATTSGGSWITIENCSGWTIRNLIVDGNSSERGNVENFSAHNFQVRRCTDFAFENVKSINAPADGWRVSATTPADTDTFCKRGRFLSCTADNSGRNGISFIEAWDMQVLGGQYSNSFWTNPAQGIDIEPNPEGAGGSATPGYRGIIIQGATFFGNRGSGVQTAATAEGRDVTINGCVFHNNGGVHPVNGTSQSHGAAAYLNGSGITFTNNVIYDHLVGNGATLGVVFFPVNPSTGFSVVSGNIFRNNPIVGAAEFFGTIHTRAGSPPDRGIVISGNHIDLIGSARFGIHVEASFCAITSNTIIGDASSAIGILINGGHFNTIVGNAIKSGSNLNQIILSDGATNNEVASNAKANA